jgi:hypothetical protein
LEARPALQPWSLSFRRAGVNERATTRGGGADGRLGTDATGVTFSFAGLPKQLAISPDNDFKSQSPFSTLKSLFACEMLFKEASASWTTGANTLDSLFACETLLKEASVCWTLGVNTFDSGFFGSYCITVNAGSALSLTS